MPAPKIDPKKYRAVVLALTKGPNTVTELAELVGVAERTIHRWLRRIESDRRVLAKGYSLVYLRGDRRAQYVLLQLPLST